MSRAGSKERSPFESFTSPMKTYYRLIERHEVQAQVLDSVLKKLIGRMITASPLAARITDHVGQPRVARTLTPQVAEESIES